MFFPICQYQVKMNPKNGIKPLLEGDGKIVMMKKKSEVVSEFFHPVFGKIMNGKTLELISYNDDEILSTQMKMKEDIKQHPLGLNIFTLASPDINA